VTSLWRFFQFYCDPMCVSSHVCRCATTIHESCLILKKQNLCQELTAAKLSHTQHNENHKPVPQKSCGREVQFGASAVYTWKPLQWMPSWQSHSTWHPDSWHSLQSLHQPPTDRTTQHLLIQWHLSHIHHINWLLNQFAQWCNGYSVGLAINR